MTRRVIIGMLSAAVLCSVVSSTFAQGYNAERRQGGGGGSMSSGGTSWIPNLNAMTPEQRIEYLRTMDSAISGASQNETDELLQYQQGDRAPAFEGHGNPWKSGEAGYAAGCMLNGIFQPELGGCLEQQWNMDRYNEAREMNGAGVLLPYENPIDPLPDYVEPSETKEDIILYD